MWWVKSRRAQSDQDYETWVEGGLVPTLNQFDGGDVRATVIIFEATRVDDVRIYEDKSPTVATYWGTGGSRVPYVFPIDDGREMEKKQNGTGIGEEGAPSYTLDRAQHASVAFYSTDGGFGAKDDNLAPSTKVGGVTAMTNNSIVRRLTPTECERLQGFPDGWTEGQTDGHRYKQMGNAVAVPVVEWIMERLVAYDKMV